MRKPVIWLIFTLSSPAIGQEITQNRSSFFLGMSAGFTRLSTSQPLESDKSGVEGSFKILANHEWSHWTLDLGGGYFYGQLTGNSDTFGGQIKVITRAFIGEISPRWKVSPSGSLHFQVGPVFQILTGADASYDESGSIDELPSQFRAGAKIIYQWGQDYLWRIGASLLHDLNINQRNALSLVLDFQFGLTPVRRHSDPGHVPPLQSPEFAEVRDRSIRIYLGEALLSFPLGSERISEKARESLSRLAPVLMKNQNLWSRIRVEGHTDARDQNHQNQALSERRAGSVAEQLSRSGIPKNRVSIKGFGAKKPIDPSPNEDAYLLNRRVEIWIDEVDPAQIRSILAELRQLQ